MAAKVVMVAIPTVMGIASIRVYTLSDVPADGLVTRERLNIYSPLPSSAQTRFVPETPGVIQSGLTTAREGILPAVQAVTGACVSVKTRSVNLYYAGEDMYYYLKDPPPGFLPRFGTITMAGVLGMFLTRKASQIQRLAVPLSLMTAGAAVCYPAQTVAVVKVTGKKVYAVGQWSGSAVSSLLSSTSREPDIKGIVASQPQTAAVAKEASEPGSAQSATIPETEVRSAESVPVSDESVVAVITEEASSVALTEVSLDQTPTETDTDVVAHSVPEEKEVEAIATSDELITSVEGEETSDTKPAAEEISTDASPAEPTPPSLEPEALKAAPVEAALEEATPVEATPVEAAPEEVAPVEVAPEEAAPVEVVPVEVAPEEAVPVEVALVEAVPEEVAPEEVAPEEAVPVEVALVEAVPEEAVPEEAVPEEVAPEEVAPVEFVPVEEPAAPKASNEPTGGSGFKQNPALMDFGQSNPEDEDLYSTRS